MSMKDRFLQDNSGAVMAEWVLMTAVVLTICMVSLTAMRNGSDVAEEPVQLSATGV